MEKIYLASKSPRRAELLGRMGIPFEVCAAEVDEQVSGEPAACVEELARRKADAGAERVGAGWVLAADTLVFLDGMALGKPENEEKARRMLRALSGRSHQVLTGMCLRNAQTGQCFVRHDGACITFGNMSDEEICDYVASGEPLDKAGAYGIQGLGGQFISRIEGDYYATVGLSLYGLRALLRRAGLAETENFL